MAQLIATIDSLMLRLQLVGLPTIRCVPVDLESRFSATNLMLHIHHFQNEKKLNFQDYSKSELKIRIRIDPAENSTSKTMPRNSILRH